MASNAGPVRLDDSGVPTVHHVEETWSVFGGGP